MFSCNNLIRFTFRNRINSPCKVDLPGRNAPIILGLDNKSFRGRGKMRRYPVLKKRNDHFHREKPPAARPLPISLPAAERLVPQMGKFRASGSNRRS